MSIAPSKHHLGYLFWLGVDSFLTIGVTRLFLFPIAAYIIGKEHFGVFATAISVVLMVGTAPSMGLTTGLLRHMADYPPERRTQLYRTGLQMCHRVMVVFVVVGMLLLGVVSGLRVVPTQLLACILPLGLALYSDNQFYIISIEMRASRRFRDSAVWDGLQAAIRSVLGLFGAFLGGSIGLACGYAFGSPLAYVLLRFRRHAWFQEAYDRDMARTLKKVWLHITIATFLILSGQYLNRILLKVWYPFADVADLYAATSVVQIFVMPVTCGSALLMNMLASYRSLSALSRGAKTQCVATASASIALLPLLLWITGSWLLKLMFPGFGDAPKVLLHILVWGVPLTVLMSWVRPFVLKFAPVQVNPFINGVAMAGQLIPALALIPSFGGRGAAWAVVIGNAVYALALIVVLFFAVLYRRPSAISLPVGCEGSPPPS